MGQFKPMVKMMTTEPTVELKLKKGGSAHKKMKQGGDAGHKPMQSKMADGGMLGALAGMPSLVKGPVAPVQRARTPARPSMAARRAAMAAGPRKVMKSGGDVEKELKAHEAKPASKAHAGLKKGGACYKNGGLAKSGIIKSESGKTKMVTAEGTNHSPAKTGDVKLGNGGGYKTGGVVKGNGGGYKTGGVALGNAGGFKKGGSSKKAFASGGSVNNEGKATSMPQGAKKPSSPVSINKLSGTFKKGGNVSSKKLQNVFKSENAPAMKAAKAKLLDKYSPYQKADGGPASEEAFQDAVQSYRRKITGQGTISDQERQELQDARNEYRKGQGAVSENERRVVRDATTSSKKYPSGLTDTDIDRIINSKPVKEGMARFVDRKKGGKVGK